MQGVGWRPSVFHTRQQLLDNGHVHIIGDLGDLIWMGVYHPRRED